MTIFRRLHRTILKTEINYRYIAKDINKNCLINHTVNNVPNIFGTRSFIFGYCLVYDLLDLDNKI